VTSPTAICGPARAPPSGCLEVEWPVMLLSRSIPASTRARGRVSCCYWRCPAVVGDVEELIGPRGRLADHSPVQLALGAGGRSAACGRRPLGRSGRHQLSV